MSTWQSARKRRSPLSSCISNSLDFWLLPAALACSRTAVRVQRPLPKPPLCGRRRRRRSHVRARVAAVRNANATTNEPPHTPKHAVPLSALVRKRLNEQHLRQPPRRAVAGPRAAAHPVAEGREVLARRGERQTARPVHVRPLGRLEDDAGRLLTKTGKPEQNAAKLGLWGGWL